MRNRKKLHPNILDYSIGPRLKASPNHPHLKIEKYAKEMPEAVAVFYQDQKITYSNLNSKANKLAQLLISLNVQRNSIVGIYLRRCPELVLATIATHKANAACSLLDPNLPLIRLNEIIGELKPTVIITSKPHTQYFIEHNIKVIDAESIDGLIAAYPDEIFPNYPEPDDTAYIFFTSGSTGKPKAVISPYGWVVETIDSPPLSERHMLKTDSGTTFTRAEVLRPLVNGQHLFIAPAGLEKNLHGLIAFIQQHRITNLISTPSALAAMLEIDDFRNCHSLTSILCSGEVVPAKLRHELNAAINADLLISYGSTEAPGAVTFTFDPKLDVAPLTVGKTAPLMEAYVLDENLTPLGVGVEGEVYLGGMIAKGYMNDPELTSQKFIPNPFHAGHGYLFKTGDSGKWLPGGYLQILRRMDSQIKIRGYRIELEEIEKVLLQDPCISQAAVMTSTHPNGQTSIVAYIVPRFGGLKSADIRIAIKQVLPDYMIPDRFIITSRMPLTANGKIDRTELHHAIDEAVERAHQIKPQDPIEKSLVSIWESLLNISPIGTNENFFDLGGNSLLAAQMLTQAEKLFQKKLSLDLLWFNEGTILSFANILRNNFQVGLNPELITLKQGDTKPLFVVHVRGGYLQDYHQLSRCLAPRQTVIGLQARGVLGLGKPDMRLEKIAVHCIESMQSIQPKGPYLLAGFSSGGMLAYEIAQQLKKRGESLALLVLLDTYCQNNNLFIRLSRVTRQLFKGRTRALRDYLYSLFIRALLLDKVGIYNDTKRAHRWAHMHYRIKKTAQKTLLFLAEGSLTKTGKKMLGWDQYLVGDVTQYHFPCSHIDLVRYPFVTEVAEKLQPHLDQANLKN